MIKRLSVFLFLFYAVHLFAAPSPAELSVWVNEAIVATYTYDYQNYLEEQRVIAHYFTPQAWITYTQALTAAQLPDAVQKNQYFVTAVATSPPEVTVQAPGIWQAKMPVLVVYKNAQYEQKQTLEVTLSFKSVPASTGVRGLAIESFQSVVVKPACRCDV